MARLTTGGVMPDFTFDTPFEAGRTLAETAARVKGKIAATGGQLLVVLQSDAAKLSAQLQPGDLPFDIVCDPEQKLYRQFEIAPAKSKLKMASLATIKKINAAKSAGFTHGDYEGDELQLPAAFVVDADLKLTYAHYGASVADVPTPEELVTLLA